MTRGFRQFYCETPLAEGQTVATPEGLRHRLLHVLRLKEGTTVHVFDGRHGLFEAVVEDGKARTLQIGRQVKPYAPRPPLALLVGLPKRDAFETVIRQAVELGVTAFLPLLAEHSVPTHLNTERIRGLIVEAAEQCERLDIPTLAPPQALRHGVMTWLAENTGSRLYWADETAPPTAGFSPAPQVGDALLVGPEGGFSEEEQVWLRGQESVVPVSLGETVLRTDTAAVAALTLLLAGRQG